jgi:hypothetical protein
MSSFGFLSDMVNILILKWHAGGLVELGAITGPKDIKANGSEDGHEVDHARGLREGR